MKFDSYGRLSTFALLTAAMALGMQAQTAAQTASPITKALAVPAKAADPSMSPAPTAPTVAKPIGSKESPVVVAAMQAAPAKKPGEVGVTMHGHWIIDLRNADGTLAEHRDFENALVGPVFLYQLVTGQYVEGDLGITIASTGAPVCFAGTGASGLGGCLVAASSTAGLGGFTGCSTLPAGTCNYTLKESVTGGPAYAITLSGTMPVLSSGSVTQVGTEVYLCNSGGAGTYSTIDPVGCYNGTEGGSNAWGTLTATSITALNAITGQTITFTVVLTFT